MGLNIPNLKNPIRGGSVEKDVRETPAAAISAPISATYITKTADTNLTNEQALADLTTGVMKVTTGSGTVTTAIDGTDFIASLIKDTTPELGGEMDCGAHTIGFTEQAASGDGSTTIDWKLGNKFKFTFGAQNDTFTFTAPTNPCNIILVLIQDGTGGRTATWPGAVKWPGGTAPTLSTGSAAVDLVAFYFDGTSYHGVASLNYS